MNVVAYWVIQGGGVKAGPLTSMGGRPLPGTHRLGLDGASWTARTQRGASAHVTGMRRGTRLAIRPALLAGS